MRCLPGLTENASPRSVREAASPNCSGAGPCRPAHAGVRAEVAAAAALKIVDELVLQPGVETRRREVETEGKRDLTVVESGRSARMERRVGDAAACAQAVREAARDRPRG